MSKERDVAHLWALAGTIEQGGDPGRIRRAYEDIVARDPVQAGAWLKLSQLSLHEGDYRDALNAALRAAEAAQFGRRWRALPYVASQLLHFDERARVSVLIRAADWASPEVLAQSAVLAQRLWLAGDDETALALLDFAIARLPAHPLLHFSRGEVLNHLGRLGEAEAEYERSLELEPLFAQSHRALAYGIPSAEPGARVPRVEAALAAAIAAGRAEDEVDLRYALFKELDGAGRVDEAWRQLQAAAALRRHRQGHDAEADAAGAAALIGAFGASAEPGPAAPVGHRRGHIFVVGMPRSGTTVLDRMLGNHPLVGSAGELNAFARSVSWEANSFYEPPPREKPIRRMARLDWRAVGTRYAAATRGMHPDKPYLLDKNPLNVHNAGFIARALPQARILCLLRDPMDACFSNLKALFAKGSYTYSYDQRELAEHYARFLRLVRHWEDVLPDRFRTVRYEALVNSPEQVLGDAMRFCGLEYDPAYADITRNPTPVSTASRAQVRQPLNRRGIGAWRRYERQLQPLRQRLRELGVEIDG